MIPHQTEAVATSIRIEHRFQGPTGSGQGGWTAHRFASAIGSPVEVSIRAPIPLDTELRVVADADSGGWRLVTHDGPGGEHVMTAVARDAIDVATSPVSIEQALAARGGFGAVVGEHPVPECFSCGVRPHSMRVHAGPLADGSDRYATDWSPPEWAVTGGIVDDGAVWAALDCTAAWYVCTSRGERTAFTVRYAAEVLRPLRAEETYSLVGWGGPTGAEWNGRKRGAASAAFASDGTCVARSTSLWVAVD